MSEELIDEVKEEISTGKKVRVAINGFGRIGRMILRAGYNDPNIEFVIINDLSGAETCAYLLKHDSAHQIFEHSVSHDENSIIINDKKIDVISERDINKLPWKEHDIDIVAECTGIFTNTEDAKVHMKQGAKKILISAPGKGDCFYFVRGVNDQDYIGQHLVSNGSCTTNSMTAVVNELNKKYGIVKGMFSTVHSMTGDQRLVDAAHKDPRRGRSAPANIIPTSTGAAKSVIKLIPELEGKLHGIAYRVPTITGSVTDLNLELKNEVSKEEVNAFLKELSQKSLNGIIEYSEENLVSTDIVGNPHSGIVDGLSTEVVDKKLVKLVVWYDNEWGFSNRMVEVIKVMGNSK